MHYFTISEYARAAGITRQSVQGRIRRGKLSLVKRMIPQTVIALTDIELEKIKVI